MSRQKYRGNLLSANFPLLSYFTGHSVIIPQIDQFYIRTSNTKEISDSLGIPEAMFMENVLPVANGLSSVGFTEAVPSSGLDDDFDQAFWLRDFLENRTLFVPAHGKNYLFNSLEKTWSANPIFVSRDSEVSVANIKQRTFVCYSKYLQFFEWLDGALVGLQFTGLTSEAVNGLVSANAYLIAYTDDTIYWSSINDPTDFMPSLATTAGSTKVLSVKGKIRYAVSLSDGFLIYTTFNAIAATYTGNPAYPWTFKEVSGSSGIDETTEITTDNNAVAQYANTQNGLAKLDKSESIVVWPQITEFLNCRRIESYDYTKKKIVESDILDSLVYKLTLVANRFLVLSYGYYALQYALIYDNGIGKWGKIRLDHVDPFEYVGHPDKQAATDGALRYIDLDPRTFGELTETYEELGGVFIPGQIGEGQRPYKSLGFMKQDGQVVIIDFDLTHQPENSVLYLGRYQLVRNRFMDLFEVCAERMAVEPGTSLAVLSSLDGTTIHQTVYPPKDKRFTNGELQAWLVNLSAHNYILRFEGRFDLHNLELTFDQAGYR